MMIIIVIIIIRKGKKNDETRTYNNVTDRTFRYDGCGFFSSLFVESKTKSDDIFKRQKGGKKHARSNPFANYLSRDIIETINQISSFDI